MKIITINGVDYSEKELLLIISMNMYSSIDNPVPKNPILLYILMANKAFCEDLKGKNIDSLRRCCNYINNRNDLKGRLTEEFDSLIELD